MYTAPVFWLLAMLREDTIEGGDVPVVWSNTRYRMIYMNMGHGDKIFNSAEQNRLFEDALESLLNQSH